MLLVGKTCTVLVEEKTAKSIMKRLDTFGRMYQTSVLILFFPLHPVAGGTAYFSSTVLSNALFIMYSQAAPERNFCWIGKLVKASVFFYSFDILVDATTQHNL